MRVSRIYTSALLNPGDSVILDEKASHHLSKVLRQPVGAALILFNGDGNQYNATISAINKRAVTADINESDYINNESPLAIHLGIAISKGDRMDWVIQKATELGVNAITPLTSERTEIKLKGERLEKKMLHWQQISISACEQSGRNRLVTINPLCTVDEWIETTEADKKFVLHHRTDQQLDARQAVSSAALLIGPEGGLSQSEIDRASGKGFSALQLGPRVLRTETAPLAALAVLQHVWGDS